MLVSHLDSRKVPGFTRHPKCISRAWVECQPGLVPWSSISFEKMEKMKKRQKIKQEEMWREGCVCTEMCTYIVFTDETNPDLVTSHFPWIYAVEKASWGLVYTKAISATQLTHTNQCVHVYMVRYPRLFFLLTGIFPCHCQKVNILYLKVICKQYIYKYIYISFFHLRQVILDHYFSDNFVQFVQ